MDEIIRALDHATDVFYQGMTWKLWHDVQRRDGQLQVDIDHFLLEQHAQHKIPAVIRLWQNCPCLVLSRHDTRHPGFELAKHYFADHNIPLYIRSTGGTVVPHGPGVLNISLIFSSQNKITLDDSYLMLCNLVRRAVNGLGVDAAVSEVPGAFCDGRYNLTIGGRKVGGTAQRLKKSFNGGKSFLSHMCFLFDVDVADMVDTLAEFYRRCGVDYQLKPETITSLVKEMNKVDARKNTLPDFLRSFDSLLNEL